MSRTPIHATSQSDLTVPDSKEPESSVEEVVEKKPKVSDFAMLASDDGWAFHSSMYN